MLGPDTPPNDVRSHLQAIKVGMMAGWSAGLIIGVGLLMANNPRKRRPVLPTFALFHFLPPLLFITAACGVGFALIGRQGWLNACSIDFRQMWETNIFRPKRFMTVWGAHLGGYAGGFIGLIYAISCITRKRKQVVLR